MEQGDFQFMGGFKLLFSFILVLALHSLIFYSSESGQSKDSEYKVQFKYSETSLKPQKNNVKKSRGNKAKNASSPSGIIQPARPKSEISPIYPDLSRIYKEQGLVTINAQISKSGQVTEAKIKRSSGFDRLDQAALQAVYAADFIPTKEDREAIATSLDLDFNFQLNN